MSEWIAVIGTLLGTLAGSGIGFVQARARFRNQRSAEDRRLLRSRLEDLYRTSEEIKESFDASFHEAMLRVEGMSQESQPTARRAPLDRMRMLVGLYAPSLEAHAKAVLAARHVFGEALVKTIGVTNRQKSVRQQILGELAARLMGMQKACDRLIAGTVELANRSAPIDIR